MIKDAFGQRQRVHHNVARTTVGTQLVPSSDAQMLGMLDADAQMLGSMLGCSRMLGRSDISFFVNPGVPQVLRKWITYCSAVFSSLGQF